MSQNTLLDNVWKRHLVRTLPNGNDQLYIALHLIHEVTSPQAFDMLRERNLRVKCPARTFATVDHIVPTDDTRRPLADPQAEQMLQALERNTSEFGINYFGLGDPRQGIVHVIGPELGLTQPGMTIACGDSHTSTHGAFGTIAFGIGTTEVANVLASQCLLMQKPKVRRIEVNGKLPAGVFAKDVILAIINRLGVKGGIGYAYEYGGKVFDDMSMEERMTVCNMSIEGGARCGYVNPDRTTRDYLGGRRYMPTGYEFDRRVALWDDVRSDLNASYDDEFKLNGSDIPPMVTWGITPGQSVGVNGNLPVLVQFPETERPSIQEAFDYMGFRPGQAIAGTKIDVAFIGSCTNGRLSDLREAAHVVNKHSLHVAPGVRALVVPGSAAVRKAAEAEGLHDIFRTAGFDWRGAGCSMCLAMNPDKLNGREICASSSNRNFKGRQGSPTGRTLLMSPVSVAVSAAAGAVVDARDYCKGGTS